MVCVRTNARNAHLQHCVQHIEKTSGKGLLQLVTSNFRGLSRRHGVGAERRDQLHRHLRVCARGRAQERVRLLVARENVQPASSSQKPNGLTVSISSPDANITSQPMAR